MSKRAIRKNRHLQPGEPFAEAVRRGRMASEQPLEAPNPSKAASRAAYHTWDDPVHKADEVRVLMDGQ